MSQPRLIHQNARELFRTGELPAAIAEMTREVKENPSDTRLRIFLFELLCFQGDWPRAEKQLKILSTNTTQTEIGAFLLHQNICAEQSRNGLMIAGIKPEFLMPPPGYIDIYLAAFEQVRAKNFTAARQLLDQAEEARPAINGKLNGKKFKDFRDCNDLFAPVLEVFYQDRYIWLPFDQIKRIEVQPPQELRDLLWIKTRVITTKEIVGEVFLPTIYAGSSEHPNNQVKLGRVTEWINCGDDLFLTAGLHLYMAGGDEVSIFELQEVEFNTIEKDE